MNDALIAIEGIDGSGKSTLVKYLAEKLEKEGRQVVQIATRETENESTFQAVIGDYSLDPHSPAYMFFFQVLHAKKVERARQAMKEGKIVVADRWNLSFFTWHENFGFLSRESDALREGISRLAFDRLEPSLGIYLDVDVDKALDRRLWRGEKIADIESERRLYTTVVSAYRSLARRHDWTIVDANDDFKSVMDTAWELVREIVQKIPR